MSNFKPVKAEASKMYRCLRCGWEWIPRIEGVPKNCPHPKCRSPKWQTSRIYDKKRGGKRR
jgi:hypothetical protein